jgi:hypothetical protein
MKYAQATGGYCRLSFSTSAFCSCEEGAEAHAVSITGTIKNHQQTLRRRTMGSDQTNENKPEKNCCTKMMEMMKNCFPDQDGGNTDCCTIRQKMMGQNCWTDEGKNQGDRPCC